MTWESRRLRGERVWVQLTEAGEPAAGPDGRVDIRYRPGGKVYRAAVKNLDVDPAREVATDERMEQGGAATEGTGGPEAPRAPRTAGGRSARAATGDERAATASQAQASPTATGDAASATAGSASTRGAAAAGAPIVVYTDGACTGNPGPMGIGVVILDGRERRELSEYLGLGTNNIAELTAILRALEVCPRERPLVVHSDSAYALGLLGKGWKAKANQELVAELRAVARGFRSIRWVKVAGHAGIPENERCDQLARDAVRRGAGR